MIQDQTFILVLPKGNARPAYRMRLFTPEGFFTTMKYGLDDWTPWVIYANVAEGVKRLTRKRLKAEFSQFLDTPYAKAALKEKRINR